MNSRIRISICLDHPENRGIKVPAAGFLRLFAHRCGENQGSDMGESTWETTKKTKLPARSGLAAASF